MLRFQNRTLHPYIPLMFAGDFNSCPCTAVYQLMAQGSVPKDHIDWTKHRLPPSLYPKCICGLVGGIRQTQELRCVGGGVGVDGGVPDCADHSLHDGFQGIHLQHDFNFQSACGTPRFTNYTETFVGALDYIFVGTDHLQVTAMVTFPSLEEVRELVVLPSVHFPSDHVALVCDVSWKSPINKVNVLQMC